MKTQNSADSAVHPSVVIDVENVNSTTSISAFTATSIIIGAIVGVGGFVIGGDILKLVGSPGMTLFLWSFAGLLVFCGSLSYVEFNLMIQESGGDIPYLEFSFRKPPRLFSFLYCWARIMLIHPAALACFCVLSTNYIYAAISYPHHVDYDSYTLKDFERKGVAVLILCFSFLCVSFSNAIATHSVKFFTTLKFLIVAFIAMSAILSISGAILYKEPESAVLSDFFEGTTFDFRSYSSALTKCLFAYDGWANLSMVLGELRNPEKNVLRSIITSIFTVILLYLTINLSIMGVLSKKTIFEATNIELLPMIFAHQVYQNPVFAYIMAVFIILSALGVALCVLYGAARVLQYAGQVGLFPFGNTMSKQHSRFNTPFNSLLFTVALAFLFIVLPPGGKSFFTLVNMATYSMWIFYVITLIALLTARYIAPDHPRPFKVPLVCPILVIFIGIYVLVVQLFGEDAFASRVGLGLFFLGVPIYYFFIYRNLKKASTSTIVEQSVQMPQA
ncbi:b(0,+)-type amino acid transporter 1 [Coelomomyces lativittatus]|nr:b(0,+)-type amino acid transporter 1 [Coelomomyces lativittatus]